jgi:hypothetical protein
MENMIARFNGERQNGKNLAGDKETLDRYVVVAVKGGKFFEPVTLKIYSGRSRNASTVYASIWIHSEDFYTSGRGSAGGYGYHKTSEAVQGAIESAGIQLFGSPYSNSAKIDLEKPCGIGGVGDSAILQALSAIAESLGFDQFIIVN